jgi:opacity protein-like surface antigen
MSSELDLRTGKNIVPYLAFGYNSQHGNGIDTWVLGATNQFPVPALFRNSTENYRAGVRFEYSKFHMTLEQGGTTFKNDDQTTNNILNFGDLTTPILGQSIFLNSLQEAYAIRGNAIYSRGLVTAVPYSWATLSGQFLFSQPHVDVHFTSDAAGNLLLLSELLFYSGQAELATGAAKQPHVTSSVGGEIRPLRHLRIIENWMTDRFHDSALGILSTVYFTNPPAVPPPPQTNTNPESQIVNYNHNEVNAIYDVTDHLTLRAGYRHVWGDATVRASVLSQTGPFATGNLDRNVALAGVTYRPSEKFRLHLDYEGAGSDQVYFRTSLNDYQKGRARAQYQATATLAFTANFFVLSNRNPAQEVNYYLLSRDNSLAVYWTPNNSKRFSFLGEYDRATERSNIIYLVPSTLSPAVSIYRDNAHIVSSNINMALPGYSGLTPTLTFGGSLFISSGSRPTTYYQPLAGLSVPFTKKVAWRTEWRWYGLGEAFYLYEGFRAHTMTTGLHLTR